MSTNRIEPYKDPLAGFTYQDMLEMTQRAAALGLKPEDLSRLDDDWLMRSGFDPRAVRSISGMPPRYGSYRRQQLNRAADKPLIGENTAYPAGGDISIYPQSGGRPNDPTTADILAHEFGHKAATERYKVRGPQETLVRRQDKQFGSQDMQDMADRHAGRFFSTRMTPEERQVAEQLPADRRAGLASWPIPAAGPVPLMQHMMRTPKPVKMPQAGDMNVEFMPRPAPAPAPVPTPAPAPEITPRLLSQPQGSRLPTPDTIAQNMEPYREPFAHGARMPGVQYTPPSGADLAQGVHTLPQPSMRNPLASPDQPAAPRQTRQSPPNPAAQEPPAYNQKPDKPFDYAARGENRQPQPKKEFDYAARGENRRPQPPQRQMYGPQDLGFAEADAFRKEVDTAKANGAPMQNGLHYRGTAERHARIAKQADERNQSMLDAQSARTGEKYKPGAVIEGNWR